MTVRDLILAIDDNRHEGVNFSAEGDVFTIENIYLFDEDGDPLKQVEVVLRYLEKDEEGVEGVLVEQALDDADADQELHFTTPLGREIDGVKIVPFEEEEE